MSWIEARERGAVPLGLAEGSKVTRPIRKGEQLTYANCETNGDFAVTQARRRLDQADARFMPSGERPAMGSSR